MDFVDEQHIAFLEIGQQRGEVPGLGNHRAGGGAKADAQLLGDDLCQSGLAQPGRADEQHMVERGPALLGRLDKHFQISPRRRLADEIGKTGRPQRDIEIIVASGGCGSKRGHEKVSAAVMPASAWAS